MTMADYIDDLPEETQEQLLHKLACMRAALAVSQIARRPYPLSKALELNQIFDKLFRGTKLTEEERGLLNSVRPRV